MRQSYVGWSPTITGRVSFSRLGETITAKRTMCNSTSRDAGWVFGSEIRTSRDGPFPPWVMALVGQIPDVLYLADLCVTPAWLVNVGENGALSSHRDQRGALCGDVIFMTRGDWVKGGGIGRRLRQYRMLTTRARDRSLSYESKDGLRAEAATLREEIWTRLLQCLNDGDPVPGFGRATLELHRSGKCLVHVDSNTLYLNDTLKAAHLAGLQSEAWANAESARQTAEAAVGRQVFFFAKDLAHHHYHHDRHADLLLTPTPADVGDENWRRETQYALARLVIARRRERSTIAYREALGLMAYAEAFQRHLCGWAEPRPGSKLKLKPSAFLYDFGALKASLEASLKVREAKDTANRQTALFVFGFVVSGLSLIFAARRLGPQYKEAQSVTPLFDSFLALVRDYPIWVLIAGTLVALAFDQIFIRQALPSLPLSTLVGGLSRANDAVMASVVRSSSGSKWLPGWMSRRWLGFALGTALVVVVITLFIGLSVVGAYLAYSSLAAAAAAAN